VFEVSASGIELALAPPPPTGLQATAEEPSTSATSLSWLPSPDALVTGYVVYSRGIDDPLLAEIGRTPATAFATSDPFAADPSVPARLYTVSAVRADGSESVLSEFVANNDRDGDGLSDIDEATYGADPTARDTDSDGLDDVDEVDRGTNPLDPDTDHDGASDGREAIDGTDPLEAASRSVRAAGDCDGNGAVSITELQQVLNNQLGRRPATTCGDCDGDGTVSITEFQKAINCQLGRTSCDQQCSN
jgi:hypothetical protein